MSGTGLQFAIGATSSCRIQDVSGSYLVIQSGPGDEYVPGLNGGVRPPLAGQRADVDGDGKDECLIPPAGGAPAFVVNCDPRESLSIIQQLTVGAIGYDLGALGISEELVDWNGDGRADLVLRMEGQILTVLIASPAGTFPVDDSTGANGGVAAAIAILWSDFRDRINSNDRVGAASMFRLNARQRYEDAFTSLGSMAETMDDGWSALTPLSVNAEYAEYFLRQTISGVTRGYIVTFVKQQDGTWAISNM